ncbi:MAG: class I SAM-dependent methyltransferase [Cyanosarcina radialis HA8281-LM2]|jgi:ubiquinone/menaquinone biosynthesis C-methylase UbiE|nr:class I SAM-dependent methyltransferase [Cyanosarcina radialis HA8281-LM2]
MDRIIEPELMTGEAQSLAYAEANFEEPNSQFLHLLQERIGREFQGNVLDLGCGPGNITIKVAKAYLQSHIDGVDGSGAMLKYAFEALALEPISCKQRIKFIQGIIPQVQLPFDRYDLIISNSLLHHIHQPDCFWQTIKKYSDKNTPILVMDLFRPATTAEASRLVETYAGNEPEILQTDFYNSLCAAFEIPELEAQLKQAGMEYLSVTQVSDRHVLIK